MTIPTRPAPPPPNRNQQLTSNHNAPSSSSVSKFGNKKSAPPPRPPPPKVVAAPSEPLKKSGSQKSISILTNLFGTKSSHKTTERMSQPVMNVETRLPPKIPAPPPAKKHHHSIQQSHQQRSPDVQLINFDESPTHSSPPMIPKSNTGSDSVSMDSFCSSTSSPNNLGSGTTSQAESGFEDDFGVPEYKVTSGSTSRSTTFSNDPFECLDDFGAPPTKVNSFQPPSNIRNVKPLIMPKPNGGASSFYAGNNSIVTVPSTASNNFDDSLSNGKNLIKPSTVSMPTIIKPMTSNKHFPDVKKTAPTVVSHQISEESFDDDLPSLPMPTMPPPPPPFIEADNIFEHDEDTTSHAIALFDFESDVVEDLNLRANEKVYLIKQMNDEWMYGRNKRGCEGIFPLSYVEVRVPLKQVEPDSGTASRSASVSPAVEGVLVRALYTFNAETDEDLTIKENELVNVMYEINIEWLYGTNVQGAHGQFPSNFIEYVPQNLPQMPK